jgi:S1-C subfamily serine protease
VPDASGLYQRVKPAVVLISVADEQGRLRSGSGVIVRPDGLIATNYHVIDGAVSARVKLANGDIYDQVAVADTDQRKDLALIKIKAIGLTALSRANPSSVEVGKTVYFLGAPMGLEGSISQGLVSAIRSVSEVHPRLEGFRVIQFTAPIAPGSSGGPLVDEGGAVIGLATMTLVSGQNLNFAVPAEYLEGLVQHWDGTARPLHAMSSQVKLGKPRPANDVLRSAKTLCVVLSSGSPVIKAEISNRLLRWGKFALVAVPQQADLVLEVVQTGQLSASGSGNQAAAILRDASSGAELWSTTKGGSWAWSGWSNAWVGRAIADALIKYVNSTSKR